jgi:hypothetical protein
MKISTESILPNDRLDSMKAGKAQRVIREMRGISCRMRGIGYDGYGRKKRKAVSLGLMRKEA